MGLIVDETTGITTVGELITVLEAFPKDMPVSDGLHDVLKVHRVKPEKGELVEDKRGRIVIEEDWE